MKRIFVVAISLALLVATPGLATADSTHQQAINVVIARALSQRGVPYAYGGGNISGPSLGTAAVDAPAPAVAPAPVLGADPLAPNVGATGLNLSPVAPPAAEPRVTCRIRFVRAGRLRIRGRRDQDAAVVGRAVQGRAESAAVASAAR